MEMKMTHEMSLSDIYLHMVRRCCMIEYDEEQGPFFSPAFLLAFHEDLEFLGQTSGLFAFLPARCELWSLALLRRDLCYLRQRTPTCIKEDKELKYC